MWRARPPPKKKNRFWIRACRSRVNVVCARTALPSPSEKWKINRVDGDPASNVTDMLSPGHVQVELNSRNDENRHRLGSSPPLRTAGRAGPRVGIDIDIDTAACSAARLGPTRSRDLLDISLFRGTRGGAGYVQLRDDVRTPVICGAEPPLEPTAHYNGHMQQLSQCYRSRKKYGLNSPPAL